MARILVSSLPFAGHANPTSAVAGDLVQRGHRVVAYTGAKYRDRFTGVGAEWLPWQRATDYDDADINAALPGVGDGKGIRGARANAKHLLFGTAPGQAEDILAEARREPFDLLVTDQLAFGAPLAGEVLGTPWASVAVTPLGMMSRDLPPPGFPVRPGVGRLGKARDAVLRAVVRRLAQRLAGPDIDRIRAAVGLGPSPAALLEGFDSPYLILAQGVPGLEYHRSDLPGHVHFVGRLATPPGTGTRLGSLPSWWPELAQARAAGRPVVHVTQGTFDLTPDDLVKPTITGLSGYAGPAGALPLVVCATGGAPVEALGALPDNVRAAPFVPHDLLLPQVDAMVTNSGWGGVLAAVAAGVPLVVAGDSLDKPEVARRVAWSGVGLNLRTGRPSPQRVRAAVVEVLTTPSMRQRARELAAAMAAAGGPPMAGTLIEALLTRTSGPDTARG